MLRRNVLIFHQAALGDFIVTWPLAMALSGMPVKLPAGSGLEPALLHCRTSHSTRSFSQEVQEAPCPDP